MSCQQVPTTPAFNPYPRSVQVGEFEVAIGGGIWVAIGVQQLEVRAFGCLLEELVERSDMPADSDDRLTTLHQLKARCLSDIPTSRPSFQEIEQELGVIASTCAKHGLIPAETMPVLVKQPAKA